MEISNLVKKYHYTYLLIGHDHRLYIGVRSCDCLPEEDDYWGSATDKTFKPISKHIQEIWQTRMQALAHEIKLHEEFNVGNFCNKLFANRCGATTIGFDRSGCIHSSQTKQKMSEASQRLHLSETFKEKRSAGYTFEVRTNMSIKGRNRAAQFIWSHPNLGQTTFSARKLIESHNLSSSCVTAIQRGARKHHKGWSCLACVL